MVCPRCIDTVQHIFNDLQIETTDVKLGEVKVKTSISDKKKQFLEKQLEDKGFELLQDRKSKLISQIKAIIIELVHQEDEPRNINFSTIIAERLNHEYSSLSRLFSSVEGITIEKYILKQKIEKVKELLFYDELTLSEIAFKMNYSSTAHLSAQFKKETGMTPTQFKNLRKPGHHSLDSF
ncbi:helix-turn-helix domain-containing protein [Chondrinema litorale]|uniref:helix-turn-helix domain-containing protein n=1 Tax=Chondrinema litorale TaxID=2994555 RepID=UPI0025432F1D|nr:AraC family transcriptional regulator [Chondrinema litorale]UZR98786.1 AraC family transcriptional regulator [Chondrinema litorale]